MSNPAESPESAPQPDDVIAELGPLAYGLFVLSEPGELTEVKSLDESKAAIVPSQTSRTLERDLFQEKLLGELGALDL